MSATTASVRPLLCAPPRMLLAGPLPIVSTGKRVAYASAICVPSFEAVKNQCVGVSASSSAAVR